MKEEPNGNKRYKVAMRFQQKKGIDYSQIFSLVVKMTTIKTMLNIIATENMHLEQMDVKSTSLHGDLDEVLYMEQQPGYEVPRKKIMVCKLKKSL